MDRLERRCLPESDGQNAADDQSDQERQSPSNQQDATGSQELDPLTVNIANRSNNNSNASALRPHRVSIKHLIDRVKVLAPANSMNSVESEGSHKTHQVARLHGRDIRAPTFLTPIRAASHQIASQRRQLRNSHVEPKLSRMDANITEDSREDVHNRYRVFKTKHEISNDFEWETRKKQPPSTLVGVGKRPGSTTESYKDAFMRKSVQQSIQVYPDLYDAERAMGHIRKVVAERLMEESCLSRHYNWGTGASNTKKRDLGTTQGFVPDTPRMLLLGNLPDTNTTPGSMLERPCSPSINYKLAAVFPTSESRRTRKLDTSRPTVHTPKIDGSGNAILPGAGKLAKPAPLPPSMPPSPLPGISSHLIIKSPIRFLSPASSQSRHAAFQSTTAVAAAAAATAPTTAGSPGELQVQVKFSRPDESAFNPRSRFDRLAPMIVSIDTLLARPNRAEERELRVEHYQKLAAIQEMSKTEETAFQHQCDYRVSTRQRMAEDSHIIFSTKRIPTYRQSPAVVVVRRSIASNDRRKQFQTFRHIRMNQDIDATSRFYPWASFDQAKVQSTCEYMRCLGYARCAKESKAFPNNDYERVTYPEPKAPERLPMKTVKYQIPDNK